MKDKKRKKGNGKTKKSMPIPLTKEEANSLLPISTQPEKKGQT